MGFSRSHDRSNHEGCRKRLPSICETAEEQFALEGNARKRAHLSRQWHEDIGAFKMVRSLGASRGRVGMGITGEIAPWTEEGTLTIDK
jgi:hypothetical protein